MFQVSSFDLIFIKNNNNNEGKLKLGKGNNWHLLFNQISHGFLALGA
jgi:hypothetical protein